MIAEENLHPCPFCGGKPEYERIGSGRQSCKIACTECGAHMETGEVDWSSGMHWNSRWQHISCAKKVKQSSEMVMLGRWTTGPDNKPFFEVRQGWYEKGMNDRRWYTIDHEPFEPTHFTFINQPRETKAVGGQ